MKKLTSYQNKKAGSIVFAFLFTLLTSVLFSNYASAQTYSGPFVITKGGTYTGNWESTNTEIPAVEVRTSEPVIITNSNIRGAGYLIKSWGHHANITVRHTNGYGLTPTPWSNYMKPRRFLALDVFKNAVIENCYMENTAGIYLGVNYTGNNTPENTVKIRYNKVKNIDGRIYGGKDRVQFVQFNFKGAIRNVEVAWNQVLNEPNNSAVEDNINMFNTQGTSDSPIRIHNNFIKGAYPIPATGTGYTGGGIISDTNADLATATKHIDAYENHLVNLGNYSMGIAGGNNIRYHHNRAVNSATFPDGTRFNMYTSGLWSNDYYKMGTTFSNSIDHNEVGITAWGYPNNRHDFNANQWASYINNINIAGTITLQTESDEFSRWQEKLSRNGIVLGPNGSAGSVSTPSVTAPEPIATTTPTTGSNGKLSLDYWSGVYGTNVSAVPTDKTPSKSAELTSFEAPTGQGNNYGQRIRGYVTAPVSGQYTFWIAADDMAELFLSTSEDPAKKTRIAYSHTWTNAREWTKNSTQQSVKITLEAGKRYYIEALYLQGGGGDNLAVGWQLPNGSLERPIVGTRISQLGSTAPATVAPNQAPAVTLSAPTANASFVVGTAITLTANATDADGKVARVEFFHGTTKVGESTASPFSYNWSNATVGSYSVTAKATDDKGATTTSAAVNVTVKEAPVATVAPTTGTTGSGKISLDYWSGVYGTNVSAVPTDKTPSKSAELTSFEAPTGQGNNYGQRIRGYVTAPVSGQYTFWIAADDMAELFLSTSEDPAKKTRIAYSHTWTNAREWTKNSTQQSVKITLEAGKRYYIEALYLQGGGGDNLAVGWQLPNGSLERPIAGNRLSTMGSTAAPVAPAANQAPSIALTAPTANATFETGKAIAITANATDADGNISRVEFFNGTTKLGESATAPYTYNWTNAAAGSYAITAKATDNAGAVTTSAIVNITVKEAAVATVAPTTGTTGTGKISLDYWSGVYGTNVSAVPTDKTPSKSAELTSFEAPTGQGNNYGQRIRGYVTAPVSGQYTFWIAADDMAELFLSTSEDPAKKTRIAYSHTWTNAREWTKNSTQQSVKITLEAGKRYYIEALYLQGGGGDNLAVGWQLPNGSLERPIAGNRLSPMGSTATAAPAPTAPTAPVVTTGKINLDYWSGIYGTNVSAVPTDKTPSKSAELTSFEAPTGQGNNYGQRIRGYVTAPVSGQYTFWIAADDMAELFLSTSEDPAKKTRIAYSHTWTNAREWTKNSTQQSVKITLEAGKRYYIEALYLQGGGGDNLAVGWQLPNGSLERPIAGNRLSTMNSEVLAASTVQTLSTITFTTATAYPNPFKDVVTLDLGNDKDKLTAVSIADQAGRTLHKVTNLTLVNNKLEIDLSSLQLASGMYLLKYTLSNGNSYTIKIIKE